MMRFEWLKARGFSVLFGLALATLGGVTGCGPGGESVAPSETQNETDYEAELADQTDGESTTK